MIELAGGKLAPAKCRGLPLARPDTWPMAVVAAAIEDLGMEVVTTAIDALGATLDGTYVTASAPGDGSWVPAGAFLAKRAEALRLKAGRCAAMEAEADDDLASQAAWALLQGAVQHQLGYDLRMLCPSRTREARLAARASLQAAR